MRLAQLITGSQSLRLVFLNACQGATGSDVESLGGVAAALANKGVAATLAMQFPITDQAAIEFAGKFYQRVAEGAPIDVAVQEGRRHLGVVNNNPIEWAAPMLYLTPRDGRVFRQVQSAEG
jgi:CHAT domain-containing protein